jgi:transcription elongation factor Spt5
MSQSLEGNDPMASPMADAHTKAFDVGFSFIKARKEKAVDKKRAAEEMVALLGANTNSNAPVIDDESPAFDPEGPMRIFPVKTAIGAEQRVIADMEARLMGSDSLEGLHNHIGSITTSPTMRGYVLVEAVDEYPVKRLIGRLGAHTGTTRLRGAKRVLDSGEDSDQEEYKEWMMPKNPTAGMEVGMTATIRDGAFKGEQGVIRRIDENDEIVWLDMQGAIPFELDMPADRITIDRMG